MSRGGWIFRRCRLRLDCPRSMRRSLMRERMHWSWLVVCIGLCALAAAVVVVILGVLS